MSQFTQYMQESYQELVPKVTWPTWKELQGASVLYSLHHSLLRVWFIVMDWVFGSECCDSLWRDWSGYMSCLGLNVQPL